MNSAVIVIPTYNAHEAIIDTIKRIKKYAPAAYIFVIDDSSPDNTSQIVKNKFNKDRKVLVFSRRRKQGRGSAVISGFREALKNKSFKYFIEMDADLCHDPKYIPQLIRKCQTADVVIASRYLSASKISGWNLKRKFISRGMNIFAKLLLQVPITDYTDGYRGYSRRAVEYFTGKKLMSKGFIVLSEIAYLCHKEGLKFAEIPFNFNHIAISKSNLTYNEMKEAIITLIRLKIRNS